MKDDLPDDGRRQALVLALRLGLFGAAATPALLTAQERTPGQLPAGRSIYRLDGQVLVNDRTADERTIIRPGDEVRTGPNSGVTFVVDEDAYNMRADSRLQLEGPGAIVSALRLITGGLLSVFGRRQTRISTPLATIGIRGTGVYVESQPDLSYLCTCYGETVITANDDPSSREDITSEHHDAPRYVVPDGAAGTRIREAPFINHGDDELLLLEALVGREPPFAVFGDSYGAPRRDY